jgi:hypothetical protein
VIDTHAQDKRPILHPVCLDQKFRHNLEATATLRLSGGKVETKSRSKIPLERRARDVSRRHARCLRLRTGITRLTSFTDMKINQAGAHIDQLLRQTRAHHVQLSSMADMKANILLTMSAVVITLSAPHVFKTDFQWPFFILIIFCVVTVAFAAYAVMPKFSFPRKSQSPPDVNNPNLNLLFFGDFIRLDYQKFQTAMEELMNDPSRVYEAQVRELYVLGIFLAKKKYRYLRLAYVSFITGVFVSFILLLFSTVAD